VNSGVVSIDKKFNEILLICGLLSAILYPVTDLIAGFIYEGYSFRTQAVSELFAIGAPTSQLVVLLFSISSLFLIPFAIGIWRSSNQNRSLRVLAIMVCGNAINALILWNFFPMHMRGAQPTFTDTMHIILAINPFILLSIIFGLIALKKWFRYYSIGTIVLLFLPAFVAFLYVPQIVAGQPTPFLGTTERISQYGYQLWEGVLSVLLIRKVNI
jgi:hypothetical protein